MNKLESTGRRVVEETLGRHIEHPGRLLRPDHVIGDIVPQLAENVRLPLRTAETTERADLLLGYLVPPEFRAHMLDGTADWGLGERKGAVITVGSTRNGSSHPHLFEVERVETGVRLTFADPEDTVAHRSTFKPSVIVMMQTEIVDGPEMDTEMSYIRFRGDHLEGRQTKMPEQLAAARGLLDHMGIPPMAKSEEEAILWELYLGGDVNRVQSCTATERQLRRVLEGDVSPALLTKRLATVRGTHTLFPEVFDANSHAVRVYESVVARADRLSVAV